MKNQEKVIIILTSDKEKNKIVEQHLFRKVNSDSLLKVVTSELEVYNAIFENSDKDKCLMISEDVEQLSIEEIYINLFKTNNLFDFPILFKLHSSEKIKALNNLGIPSINITINDNYEYTLSFINERLLAYEYYCNEIKSNDYFSGILANNFGITNLLSLISLNNKTGILILKKDEGNIYFEIFFEEGRITYAYENNGYFPLNGLDAIKELFQIFELNKISYDFMSDSDIKSPGTHFDIPTKEVISEVFKCLKKSITVTTTSKLKTNEINEIIDKSYEKIKKGEERPKMSLIQNFNEPIEIAEDIFWVSERNPNSLLQLNTYLRVYKKDNKSINMLIDPGAIEHFPAISKKVSNIISDVSRVNMYSINHQDPDVGMNATFLSRINPKSVCLCTEDTWRLVQFYEIPKNTYKNVYSFNDKRVSLSTDSRHVIEFVPTPYCHFVGAFALYDRAARVLFTGDLFGGLNPANNLSLFATEEHWEGVKIFHQIYMPSKIAIRNAIDSIRNLDEKPLMIVPQHGAILAGDIMELFLNRLYNLEVGIDLLNKAPFSKLTPVYLDLMNMLYTKFLNSVGENEVQRVFEFNNKSQELYYLIEMDVSGVKDIYSNHERALNLMLGLISKHRDSAIVNEIKSLAIKETLLRQIPIPVNIYSDATTNAISSNENTLYADDELKSTDDMFV